MRWRYAGSLIACMSLGVIAYIALREVMSRSIQVSLPLEQVPQQDHDPLEEFPVSSEETSGKARVADVLTARARLNEMVATQPSLGHQEYGLYQSMYHLRLDVKACCLAFAKDGSWVLGQIQWDIPKGERKFRKVDDVPIHYFSNGEAIDSDCALRIRELADDMTRLIEDQANYSLWLLQSCAEYYAFGELRRVPREAESEPITTITGSDKYRASTSITAGRWRYEIDFRSSSYPALQEALVELDRLRKERSDAVREVILSCL